MGKWCPDVVRLQGAFDLNKLGLTSSPSRREPDGARETGKFRKISEIGDRARVIEEMVRGVDEDDPDVLAALKAVVEAGLIPSE